VERGIVGRFNKCLMFLIESYLGFFTVKLTYSLQAKIVSGSLYPSHQNL